MSKNPKRTSLPNGMRIDAAALAAWGKVLKRKPVEPVTPPVEESPDGR